MPPARTYLKRDASNTEDSLCNWVQLGGVIALLVLYGLGQLTSANTAPYLIALSIALSIDPLIIGAYSSSNPSSSWSDKRMASTYAKLLTGEDGYWQRRTVSFAENHTPRDPLRFPMTIASVLFNQICAGRLMIMTHSGR